MTQLFFLNHSSLVIRHGSEFLLLDPWYLKPAFGSWLSTPPMAIHPVYLAALGPKLRILISHAHDDHCDDQLLPLFDRETQILSSNFASPSVQRRVKKHGFESYAACDEAGVQTGPFLIRSYRNEAVSQDDAVYSIRTPDAHIIHCNDCWFKLTDDIALPLQATTGEVGAARTIYMSQTNSASGFPLNYSDFSGEEKKMLLQKKIRDMFASGVANAERVGARHFLSYAGYATPFVKGHPEYTELSQFPTPSYLLSRFADLVPSGLNVLQLRPGETFDFNEAEGFFKGAIDDEKLKLKSIEFYRQYGYDKQGDSFLETTATAIGDHELRGRLTYFLEQLNTFVRQKIETTGFHPEVIGKVLRIEVKESADAPIELAMSLEFGKGVLDADERDDYNKKVTVSRRLLAQTLTGEILFENLYTGYNGEFSRSPKSTYNRDIVMYVIMFSYLFKNRLAAAFSAEGIPS